MVVAIGVRRVLLGKSCGWPTSCNTVTVRGYQPGSRGNEKKPNDNGGGLSYHLAFCGRTERSKRTLTFVAMRGGSPNPNKLISKSCRMLGNCCQYTSASGTADACRACIAPHPLFGRHRGHALEVELQLIMQAASRKPQSRSAHDAAS